MWNIYGALTGPLYYQFSKPIFNLTFLINEFSQSRVHFMNIVEVVEGLLFDYWSTALEIKRGTYSDCFSWQWGRFEMTQPLSHLGTRQLQNLSKPILVTLWQEENASALGACSGLVALARTCMSHDTSHKRKRFIVWCSGVPEWIRHEYQGATVISFISCPLISKR